MRAARALASVGITARITALERELVMLKGELNGTPTAAAQSRPSESRKLFRFERYPTRKIALRIAYLGWHHSGLAWQPEASPKSTVEGELFRALLLSRLVCPRPSVDRPLAADAWQDSVDMEGWGYSRAGRTDAGVSASGQVVSLWVRSNLLDRHQREMEVSSGQAPAGSLRDPAGEGAQTLHSDASSARRQELPYPMLLNNLLPESVRVLDWSPAGPDFDARFSCRSRHYKYLFSSDEGRNGRRLDIAAMADAAGRLVGEHDFRNLCKLDRSKQVTNFRRKIVAASIEKVHPQSPHDQLHVLNLHGSAFLYNQVRNIMAVLFLVGSRLEEPAVVDALLFTDSHAPRPSHLPADASPVDRRPEFLIADSLPLVLWHCAYDSGALIWQSSRSTAPSVGLQAVAEGLRDAALRQCLKSNISLLHLATLGPIEASPPSRNTATDTPLGAGTRQHVQQYVPLLKRRRQPHWAEANKAWQAGPGQRRAVRRSAQL